MSGALFTVCEDCGREHARTTFAVCDDCAAGPHGLWAPLRMWLAESIDFGTTETILATLAAKRLLGGAA